MKLYQYHHCPYCVRADMVANYKNVAHQKVYLANDDEKSCYDLVDAKVCPILQFEDGSAIKESLDIVAKLDDLGDKTQVITSVNKASDYEMLFAPIKPSIRILTYPRSILIGLPEFATQAGCDYFQHKKEAMIGMSFEQAMTETEQHLVVVNQMLAAFPVIAINTALCMDDVILFPMLRNLSMVKGIVFPKQTLEYMQHIVELTNSECYLNRAI